MIDVKVIDKEGKKSKDYYPRLKVSGQGQIVLFTSKEIGINVNGIGHGIGHYTDSWTDKNFHDFKGEVVLTNK